MSITGIRAEQVDVCTRVIISRYNSLTQAELLTYFRNPKANTTQHQLLLHPHIDGADLGTHSEA